MGGTAGSVRSRRRSPSLWWADRSKLARLREFKGELREEGGIASSTPALQHRSRESAPDPTPMPCEEGVPASRSGDAQTSPSLREVKVGTWGPSMPAPPQWWGERSAGSRCPLLPLCPPMFLPFSLHGGRDSLCWPGCTAGGNPPTCQPTVRWAPVLFPKLSPFPPPLSRTGGGAEAQRGLPLAQGHPAGLGQRGFLVRSTNPGTQLVRSALRSSAPAAV